MGRSGAKHAIVVEVVKAGISGLTFILLARSFGPDLYGKYVLISAIAGYGFPLITFGYPQWVQPAARRSGLAGPAGVSAILLATLVVPLGALVSYPLSLWAKTDPVDTFLIFLIEIGLYPLWMSSVTAFLAVGRARLYSILSIAVPGIKLGSTFIASLLFPGDIRAWATVTALAGVIGLSGYAVPFYLRRPRAAVAELKTWWRKGFHFSLVSLASLSADYLDKIVLSLGSMNQLGTYGAASRFGSYTAVPLKGQALAFYPTYFELAEQKRYGELREILRRNSRRGLQLGLAVAVTSMIMIGGLSYTLLKEYGWSLVLLSAVLACAAPFRAVQYAYGDALYALGKPTLRLAISAGGAAASLIFVAIGVLSAGPLGAAIGSSLGVVSAALLVQRVTQRLTSGRHRRS